MKVAITLAAVFASIGLALVGPAREARAAAGNIEIPDFPELRAKASENVDVNVGPLVLKLAQHFVRKAAEDGEMSDDDRAALEVLQGIHSVRVRSFKFEEDNAYSTADVERLRHQLDTPAWSRVVQVHKREPQEDVDVFICLEDGKARGLTVIASEPREFTVVNIVGNIDMDKFAKLEGKFNIPKVSQSD